MAANTDLDAEWKRIQKKTFERWCNLHLSKRNLEVYDLAEDFEDGLLLCALVELLTHKSLGRLNKHPRMIQQRMENCTLALNRITADGVKLVNIGSEDIAKTNLKLVLGLIWTLILHYQISMNLKDVGKGKSPSHWLLEWLNKQTGVNPVKNFTTDWNDGRKIAALVNAVKPGLFPDYAECDPANNIQNIKQAMQLANDWLDIPMIVSPEDMANPNIDEKSMITYLSYFPNAQCKHGAPLGQNKQLNVGNVKVYGPALEGDVVVCDQTNFFIDATTAGNGEIGVGFSGPAQPKVDVIANQGQPHDLQFNGPKAGDYDITITFNGKEIPHSPVRIHVVPRPADASKVRVEGLHPVCKVGDINTFNIIANNAGGSGFLEVGVLGPTQPCNQIFIEHKGDFKFETKFVVVEKGTFLVSIKWHGDHVPGSPFEVKG